MAISTLLDKIGLDDVIVESQLRRQGESIDSTALLKGFFQLTKFVKSLDSTQKIFGKDLHKMTQ